MGKFKDITDKISDAAYVVAINVVRKPVLLAKHLLRPGKIFGETYFPEREHKSRLKIWTEQALNIIRYGSIDEYYYMYGHDVKGLNKNSDYVIYSVFMTKRDKLNLSNPHNDSPVLRNKIFFSALARTINISSPAIVAVTSGNSINFLDRGERDAGRWDDLHLFDGCVMYCKPLDGQNGEGVTRLEISPDFDVEELRSRLKGGTYLLQKGIVQHHEMSRLYPLAVNTIRLITIRNRRTGEIEILPPTLRIGAHGNVIDNFSQGGIIVAVDMETGRLHKEGFRSPNTA